MRLLITGAAGMLGRDLQAAASAAGHDVVALSRAELDITARDAVEEAIGAAEPEVVINCAAYTDVDGAQADPDTAHAVNGQGAGNVAWFAAARRAWTIHISSDYVFDGTKGAPYVESDDPRPLSVYGASKAAGEHEVARSARAGGFTVVRSSWLFGAGGPCFPATMLRLAAERDELTVVDDQVGCPTFTGHLAAALVELAGRPRPPHGIVHLAAAGQCSWYEFAQAILHGHDVEVRPGRTADLGRPAPRPAYSVMRTGRDDLGVSLPDWREGLAAYLATRVAA
jgi:dTDP-4-dehydrorhamnose reductase